VWTSFQPVCLFFFKGLRFWICIFESNRVFFICFHQQVNNFFFRVCAFFCMFEFSSVPKFYLIQPVCLDLFFLRQCLSFFFVLQCVLQREQFCGFDIIIFNMGRLAVAVCVAACVVFSCFFEFTLFFSFILVCQCVWVIFFSRVSPVLNPFPLLYLVQYLSFIFLYVWVKHVCLCSFSQMCEILYVCICVCVCVCVYMSVSMSCLCLCLSVSVSMSTSTSTSLSLS